MSINTLEIHLYLKKNGIESFELKSMLKFKVNASVLSLI